MRAIIAGVALLSLASCGPGGDPKVCQIILPFPDAPALNAETCLHRNAYRLASSADDAETVARAVMQACESEVRAGIADRAESSAEAWKNSAEDIQERMSELSDRNAREHYPEFALMKVVEGRAGKCKP